jgi:hypothetical protein
MKKNRYDKIKEYNPLFLHLSKAYGDKQADRIKTQADEEYDRMADILGDALKTNKMHATFILERAALYKVLKEYYPDKAYVWIEKCIKKKNESRHESFAKMTSTKIGAGFFMKLCGIMTDAAFGEKAGFKVEWVRKDKEEVSFNMRACPYCEYLSKLGLPELTKSFCDSDEYAYCGLDNVDFIRTMTLGTGGDKCDFIYRRSDK